VSHNLQQRAEMMLERAQPHRSQIHVARLPWHSSGIREGGVVRDVSSRSTETMGNVLELET